MSQTTSATTQVPCAFCKGRGKDPFDLLSELADCQVCGGTGKVEVEEPTMTCVFCKGSGVYHASRVTCTVCGGKGMLTVPEGRTAQCPDCKGTDATTDSGMLCFMCIGTGVISE